MILGSYLSRLLPLLIFLSYITMNKDKKNIYLSSIFLVLIIFTIILSGERVAFFYSLLTILSILIFINIKLMIKLFSLSVLLVIIISTIIFNPILKERIFHQTLDQFYKKDNRLIFFSPEHQSHAITAVNIFKDYYVFGTGPKTFRKICPRDYPQFNGCTTHPHNFYLQLLSEVGIIGTFVPLILFLNILFFYFRKLISNFKYKNSHFEYSCLYLSFIITLFPILPTGNIFNNWLSIIFYLPIPFYLNYIRQYKK